MNEIKRSPGRPAAPTPKPYVPRIDGERKESERKRPLFGVRTSKLDVEWELPGFQMAWITDYDDGRLSFALECGYTYVEQNEISVSNVSSDVSQDKDTANRVSRYAGQSESNRPVRTFLMKIPKEYYEEAQAVIKEQADKQENQLYSGDQSQVSGKYIPTSVKTQIGSKIV